MTTPTIVREFEADLVVTDAYLAADDVVALTLAAADGSALPPWTPGAHVDLILGTDLVRQYSLCSSPSDRTVWRLGILRTPDSPRPCTPIWGLEPRCEFAARATISRSSPPVGICSSPVESASPRYCR